MLPPAVNRTNIAAGRVVRERSIREKRLRRRNAPPSVLMTLSRFAPMIDMSFLLLIFFISTTRFQNPEGILTTDMPKWGGGGGRGTGVALPLSPIIVRLSALNADGLDCAVSLDRFAEAPKDLASLAGFLGGVLREPGFDKETPVVIVATDEVRWDHVVGCWNAALRAGCKNIAFAAP